MDFGLGLYGKHLTMKFTGGEKINEIHVLLSNSSKQKNMKTLTIFFATVVLLISNTGCAQSQNEDKEIKSMLKEFYTAYITEISENPNLKLMVVKLDSLKKKYCTVALRKKIPGLVEQSSADPIIKAQDSNIEYLKTLAVEKDSKNTNQYIVSYYDSSNPAIEKTIIHLAVVKEKESYKVNDVW
jgi:hypothetical protein